MNPQHSTGSIWRSYKITNLWISLDNSLTKVGLFFSEPIAYPLANLLSLASSETVKIELIKNEYSKKQLEQKLLLLVYFAISHTASLNHVSGDMLYSLYVAESCLGHDTSMRNVQIWK